MDGVVCYTRYTKRKMIVALTERYAKYLINKYGFETKNSYHAPKQNKTNYSALKILKYWKQ